jgi:hypothetical protein
MSLSDLCNGVFSSAKALSEGLEEPLKPEGLIDLVNQAIHLSNWLWDEIEKRHITDFEDIACKKGCSWCCYKQVGVSPLQVFLIAEHLKNKRIKIYLEDIKSRLTALDQITNDLTSEARLAAQLPCAFLVENSCSIYEVRPLACRVATLLMLISVDGMSKIWKMSKRRKNLKDALTGFTLFHFMSCVLSGRG